MFMKPVLPILILAICLTGCAQKYFIVRHAEKAQESSGTNMHTTGNPPLSSVGQQRAQELAERLKKEKIGAIYSTNTSRTIQTATPTAEQHGITVVTYGRIDSVFVQKVLEGKSNTLIVGHSNTVDDLVNKLTGENRLQDLPDHVYDRLFILTRKGKRLTLVESNYGQPSRN